MNARLLQKLILVSLLAFLAPLLCAQDSAAAALAEINLATPAGEDFAIADFDGDNKPDAAVLVDSGLLPGHGAFLVEIQLTGRINSKLTFESTENGHTVAAWDIDNDSDIDIVVARGLSQRGLRVWLNDGKGSFHRGRIEDFPGAAAPLPERFSSQSGDTEKPVFSLLPTRCFEAAILARRPLVTRLPAAGKSQTQPSDIAPSSREIAQNPSRAPPLT